MQLGWAAVDAVDRVHVLRTGRHHGDHITERLELEGVPGFGDVGAMKGSMYLR